MPSAQAFGAQYHGYSTDELFFFNYEWGGRPWEPHAQEVIKKFDPINFVDKWETPMLIIHGSKDYRLPETDGIGAFHALQQYVISISSLKRRRCLYFGLRVSLIGAGSRVDWSSSPMRTTGC